MEKSEFLKTNIVKSVITPVEFDSDLQIETINQFNPYVTIARDNNSKFNKNWDVVFDGNIVSSHKEYQEALIYANRYIRFYEKGYSQALIKPFKK